MKTNVSLLWPAVKHTGSLVALSAVRRLTVFQFVADLGRPRMQDLPEGRRTVNR